MSGKHLTALHFALSFFPVYGGMSTRLSNMLSDGLHHHALYVPRSPSSYIPEGLAVTEPEDRYGNIHVRRCPMPLWKGMGRVPILDYLSLYRYHRRAASALRSRVVEEPLDLVYGHGPMEFSLAALGEAAARRLPLVYEMHGLHHDNLYQARGLTGPYHRLMQRPLLALERRVLCRARVLIAQTESVARRARQIYRLPGADIRVLYNGVDAERFSSARWKEESVRLRRERGWEGKTVFLYSGQLDRINGVDLLLSAAAQLPAELAGRVIVVFAGRGVLAAEAEAASRRLSWVQYLGMWKYEEMPRLMGAADAFVIPRPSTLPAETLLPVKLLEAMAMERAVLVSGVGGMTEVVEDGVSGFVFPPGDQAALVERLAFLAGDGARRRAVGEQARQRVAGSFSWRQAHRQLDRIYREVTGGD